MSARSNVAFVVWPILAAAVALAGCQNPPFHPVDAGCKNAGECCADSDCAKNSYCDPATSQCVSDVHQCDALTDAGPPSAANSCCPGQKCNASIDQCTDSYTACTSNASCPVAGQYCDMTLGVFPQGPGCTFNTCNPANGNADCAAGLSCFNSYCIGQPPCGGGCASGSVCTPVNNQCFQPTSPSASCLQSCGSGSLLVFKNGLNVFDHCDYGEESQCACEVLPGLTTYDGARYSQAALTSSTILVSAYDGEYGDLLLHSYDKATQKELAGSPQWIDGVPATGTVTGNPAGPRNGISDPGPDVGRYTSIAYDATRGTTHIAYYAVATNGSQDVPVTGATPIGALRYARRIGTGSWTIISAVDATGDVGLYTSLTLAPDGSPVIAYFQRGGSGTNAAVTAVKVARATSPTPMTAADWTITVVDTGARTVPACNSQPCPSGQACAATTAVPTGTCAATSAACTPACSSSQSCVIDGSNPACDTTLTPPTTVNLPDGNGLMPSIAYLNSLPVVVWYDHTNGQLKGTIATADSAAQGVSFSGTIQLLDDGTGGGSYSPAHDVGRFPSLAIGPSGTVQQIAVAYFDATARQTLLLTAKPDWSGMTAEGAGRVIDNGSNAGSADSVLSVGANASAQFVSGNLQVIYQDSTDGTLRLATQTSPTAPVKFTKTLTPATQNGAGGFYASLAADSSGQYASQAVITAQGPTTPNNQLQVIKLP